MESICRCFFSWRPTEAKQASEAVITNKAFQCEVSCQVRVFVDRKEAPGVGGGDALKELTRVGFCCKFSPERV